MRARDLKLIDQIQADALDSDVSISDTLRKLIALGGEVGSTELREWASRELRGYGDISADDLPDYRKPSAVILVNAINGNYKIDGQQISPRQLPDPVNKHVSEEVPLWQGIGQIEAMVQQARGEGGYLKLTIPRSQDVAAIWNHDVHQGGNPYQNITAIYWNMSEVALRGVVDQVRTTLVELVAEMRAGMPDDVDNPSAAVADNAVQVAVYGDDRRRRAGAEHRAECGQQRGCGRPPHQQREDVAVAQDRWWNRRCGSGRHGSDHARPVAGLGPVTGGDARARLL